MVMGIRLNPYFLVIESSDKSLRLRSVDKLYNVGQRGNPCIMPFCSSLGFVFLWLTSSLVVLFFWSSQIRFVNRLGIGKLSNVCNRFRCPILSNALWISKKMRVASHCFRFCRC